MKLFWPLFFSLLNIIHGCNTNPCSKKVMSNIGEYQECDMCVCDDQCGLNRDPEIYQCYIMLDKSFDVSCKVQMTDGWIAGFVIIAVIGACIFCGGGGYLIYKQCCQKKSVGAA